MGTHRWIMGCAAVGLLICLIGCAQVEEMFLADAPVTPSALDVLPDAVRDALNDEAPDAMVLEIDQSDGGDVQVRIAAGSEIERIEFDAEGNVLEKTLLRRAIVLEHEIDPLGYLPQGWTPDTTNGDGAEGDWQVMQGPEVPSRTHVIGLVDPNHDLGNAFNVLWTDEIEFGNGELSVWVRPRAGAIDQGGGPIWRVQDEDNYYVCRWNPLETNVRLYVVEDGDRQMLASASTTAEADSWQEIRVVHEGDHIVCWLGNQPILEADDDTFEEAGGVGLWTKADAITAFDGLTVSSQPLEHEGDGEEGGHEEGGESHEEGDEEGESD